MFTDTEFQRNYTMKLPSDLHEFYHLFTVLSKLMPTSDSDNMYKLNLGGKYRSQSAKDAKESLTFRFNEHMEKIGYMDPPAAYIYIVLRHDRIRVTNFWKDIVKNTATDIAIFDHLASKVYKQYALFPKYHSLFFLFQEQANLRSQIIKTYSKQIHNLELKDYSIYELCQQYPVGTNTWALQQFYDLHRNRYGMFFTIE